MDANPVEITVVGQARATHPPEQCTVSLVVRTDGRSAEAAAEPAHRTVRDIAGLIDPLYNRTSGPIDSWTLDQVRHSRHRPFDQAGEQLPYVYQALATVDVRFTQIDVVDAFVYAASALEGVEISHLDWSLTPDSASEKTRHVRTEAVSDAVGKAEAYALSVGRTAVTALAVADPGLLGVDSSPADFGASTRAFGDSGDGFELRPQAIVLSATIHARFSAT